MSTRNKPFPNMIKNHPKLSQICSYGICFKEPKNEFETAVANEPSVFEPLMFYCIYFSVYRRIRKQWLISISFIFDEAVSMNGNIICVLPALVSF